jgi:hypothetical protein
VSEDVPVDQSAIPELNDDIEHTVLQPEEIVISGFSIRNRNRVIDALASG